MEAIDFKKLLRDERKRLKQIKQQRDSRNAIGFPFVKTNGGIDTIPQKDKGEDKSSARCNWNHPYGFLGFRGLRLRSICENPRSILYSSTALEERALTNKNEVNIVNDTSSNISDSSSSTRITNRVISMSPEIALMNWLQDLPSGDSGLGEWKVMNYGKRRVCMFGENKDGVLPSPLEEIAKELVKQNVFPAPSCSPPNHVLLNEYQPGQGILPHTDGPLYEHRTATLSLGSDIVIEFTKRLTSSEIGHSTRAICTSQTAGDGDLGTKEGKDNCTMGKDNAYNPIPSSTAPFQVLLESGSLLVFQGDAYLNYCHGIEMDVWRDVTTDHCLNAPSGKIVPRGLRYSLTFRHKKYESEG